MAGAARPRAFMGRMPRPRDRAGAAVAWIKKLRRIRIKPSKVLIQLLCFLFAGAGLAAGRTQVRVRIEITGSVTSQPVVADALPDLRKALVENGYTPADQADSNAATIQIVLAAKSSRAGVSSIAPESFSWRPSPAGGGTLGAPSALSLEAAILWLSDRVASTGKIPAQEHIATRAFARSFTYLAMPDLPAHGNTREAIAAALIPFRQSALVAAHYGATDLVMYGFNRVIIWDAQYRPLADVYREFFRQAAAMAHHMGLRLFLYGDEFIYQPAWLKARGARLSTSDPKLWQALAWKYRQALTALQSIDGIVIRTGEVIPWPGVEAFDLIHNRGDHGNRDIVDNYRQFVQTLYRIIVGEFGKTYVQRTWATNNYEQSSVPEIYKEIFNAQLPTRNFYAAIKLTLTDQWEYQPLNPTFGVTPHATLASVEIDRCTSPVTDYALPFIQSGMEYAHEHGATGLLNGVTPSQLKLGVGDTALNESLAYSLWRLSWTPKANLHSILRDWAARRLGPVAADQIAEILPTLGDIVRDSWYLRPVADTNWNPQQLFGGSEFVVKGEPIWDRGAGQDRFLRDIYLTCKPWMRETMSEVAEGVYRYDRILSRWSRIEPLLTDPTVGEAWEQRIRRDREALNMYRAYVQTFLICYAYRDTPTPALRDELGYRINDLEKTLSVYQTEPNHFQLRGILVFLNIAKRTLANRAALERYLAEAPSPMQIKQMLAAREAHDSEMAKQCASAETYLSWAGAVDGLEVLTLQGDKLTDDHRRGNEAHNIQAKVFQPIPKRRLKYYLARHSGRGWTVLLETPSAENGWAAKIFVDDPEPSEDVYRFDLKAAANCGVPAH